MSLLVALDRDGTVIEERPYLSDPRQVALLPRAAEGLLALREQGFRVALVTNQSGVGRGYFDLPTLDRIHRRLFDLLAGAGAAVDGVYFCPHAPDEGCRCRKPETGLLERAASDFAAADCFVVGDKECDIGMGLRSGATTVLVRTGYGRQTEKARRVRPHYVVDDLLAAAAVINRAALYRKARVA
ncbi:MAG: HAD family hydrolase [Chloroflexi bacterium]|nr:HAD family hydrolase [Chloroflexota bacterium]